MDMKKGYFFTMDAILGASIIVICILLVTSYYVSEPVNAHINYQAQDLVRILSTLKVSEVDNEYVKELIESGQITKLNNTILEQMGEFWAEGNTDFAKGTARNITHQLIPDKFGYGFWINRDEVYKKNKTNETSLVSSKSIISGIAKDKPIEGYSSRVYLSGIKSRVVSSYIYFGGFVGNGMISNRVILPNNYSEIIECYIEFATKSDFDLYINDIYSGNYSLQQSSDLRANKWYVNESYLGNFKTGNNTVTIKFNGDNISSEYIGGGYVRVKSRSSDVAFSDVEYIDEGTAKKREYLPGIEGVINLYSSFYVPGDLSSMNVRLHYENNFTTYMTIGNKTVYFSDSDGERDVLLDDTNLTPYLSYDDISKKTIPIRIGTGNISILPEVGQGNADVILITDVSGSMDWELNSSNVGINRSCTDSNLNNSNTKRVSLAKCLDKSFVDIILNATNNRVGLVSFRSSVDSYHDLSENKTSLNNQIDGYYANSGTCICCAINRAYNILNAQSNSSRNKFIVVMSDGIPSHCCGCSSWWWFWCTSCGSTGTGTDGLYQDCGGGAADCTGSNCNGAMQNANWSSCRAHNDLDATVHSIGFGPVASCHNANWTLRSIADCGNGSYYTSSNASELQDVYRNLAEEIVQISYSGQAVIVSGAFNSTLFNNSYIEFKYEPISQFTYGETPFNFESPPFGNDISQGTLFIPDNVSVNDVKVTSYSGDKWTDNLTLENSVITQVYKLSDHSSNYASLGDPFIVQIPTNFIEQGNNVIKISTGYSPFNNSGGSYDNRVIYTLSIDTTVSYSDVGKYAYGCTWTVKFEDGSNTTIKVPYDYNGSNGCDYEASFYDNDDSINKAAYSLLSFLDIDKNGLLDAKIDQESLSVSSLVIAGVPSLWGPSIIEVRVWE